MPATWKASSNRSRRTARTTCCKRLGNVPGKPLKTRSRRCSMMQSINSMMTWLNPWKKATSRKSWCIMKTWVISCVVVSQWLANKSLLSWGRASVPTMSTASKSSSPYSQRMLLQVWCASSAVCLKKMKTENFVTGLKSRKLRLTHFTKKAKSKSIKYLSNSIRLTSLRESQKWRSYRVILMKHTRLHPWKILWEKNLMKIRTMANFKGNYQLRAYQARLLKSFLRRRSPV